MRIVHIGPCNLPLCHSRGGAIERRIVELAAAQVFRGHEVIAYSSEQESGVNYARGVEIRAVCCRQSGVRRRLEFVRRALRDVDQADILHFHSVLEGAILSRGHAAAKLLSYDYFRWRGAEHARWMYRQALKRFDVLLPVSEYCRAESLQFWRLPRQRTRVLYNGVNLQQFFPDPAAGRQMRQRLGITDAPVILYVGRVCEQKGTDLLLDAFADVKREMLNSQLVIAGPAEKFANAAETKLTQRVREVGGKYLGPVEERDLAALYNACDVFVMPTRQDEMFGMAAAEAQACGKPVVCSRHGGLVEVVTEQSGRFFPVGDFAALAREVLILLRSPELRVCLGQEARRRAARFAWQQIAEEAEQVYHDIGFKQPWQAQCKARGN